MAQRISQMLAEPRFRHFKEPFRAPPAYGTSPLARVVDLLARLRPFSVERMAERFVEIYQNPPKYPPVIKYRMGEASTKLEELKRAGQEHGKKGP